MNMSSETDSGLPSYAVFTRTARCISMAAKYFFLSVANCVQVRIHELNYCNIVFTGEEPPYVAFSVPASAGWPTLSTFKTNG